MKYLVQIINQGFFYIKGMCREGYIFAFSAFLISVFAFMFSWGFGMLGLFLTAFMCYFFRDPVRIVPVLDNILLSPADGVITSIYDDEIEFFEDNNTSVKRNFKCVRIALNVLNVHVNRMPCDCKINAIKYQPGSFMPIINSVDANQNERNEIFIEDNNGNGIIVVQQVGMLARRIVCNVSVGQNVKIGDKIGLMKFGSMMALYFPDNFNLNIASGQTVVAGETIIASLDDRIDSNNIEYKES